MVKVGGNQFGLLVFGYKPIPPLFSQVSPCKSPCRGDTHTGEIWHDKRLSMAFLIVGIFKNMGVTPWSYFSIRWSGCQTFFMAADSPHWFSRPRPRLVQCVLL